MIGASPRSITLHMSSRWIHGLMERIRVNGDREIVWRAIKLTQYFVMMGLSEEVTFAVGETCSEYLLPVSFTARHTETTSKEPMAYIVTIAPALVQLTDELGELIGCSGRARIIESALAFLEMCLDARQGGATIFKIPPGKQRAPIPWTEVPFL